MSGPVRHAHVTASCASFSAGSIAQYLFRIVFARYRSPRFLFFGHPSVLQAEVVSALHALHAVRCDAQQRQRGSAISLCKSFGLSGYQANQGHLEERRVQRQGGRGAGTKRLK